MHTRFAGAVALLATGLLAGSFLYGRAIVVPTFASSALDVHLAFRVELMKRNAGLHAWDVFNDIRTAAALGAFLSVVVAAGLATADDTDRAQLDGRTGG